MPPDNDTRDVISRDSSPRDTPLRDATLRDATSGGATPRESDSRDRTPRGMLSIRTLCMPADTNPFGDIFGGWLLGQMDIAGATFAASVAGGRTTTVAVDAMSFKKPVHVGDVICLYTELIRVGATSITVHVEAWVIRNKQPGRLLVTEGAFTYVALDDDGHPRKVESTAAAPPAAG